MDEATTAAALVAGGTIVTVVEVLKEALGLPSRFARLASLVAGAALGVGAAALTDADIGIGAAGGFLAGIAATASYVVAKRNATER